MTASEVEQVIWSHPAVQDCAVIGVPDDKWGEAVKAVVRGVLLAIEYFTSGPVIVPVPATCLPPLSLPGVISSMIPSANIMPADGPPMLSPRLSSTSTGKS